MAERDSTYLVALYRHLAPARRQITRGVVQELEQLEQELTAAVDHSSSTDTSLGALASAFLTAGLIDHSRISDLQRRSSAQIDTKSVAELVDLVTVPGRFGLNIPIELLARSWGMSDFADIAQLLRGFDLIHAFEDSSGRVIVGPRSLAGKPLAGFRATPSRGNPVLYGMVVYAIRFKNPLLHR